MKLKREELEANGEENKAPEAEDSTPADILGAEGDEDVIF
jgi:hypothetical protein